MLRSTPTIAQSTLPTVTYFTKRRPLLEFTRGGLRIFGVDSSTTPVLRKRRRSRLFTCRALLLFSPLPLRSRLFQLPLKRILRKSTNIFPKLNQFFRHLAQFIPQLPQNFFV